MNPSVANNFLSAASRIVSSSWARTRAGDGGLERCRFLYGDLLKLGPFSG